MIVGFIRRFVFHEYPLDRPLSLFLWIEQQFTCSGCGGWILLRLNPALNISVVLVCPNCSHEHYRKIEHGLIHGCSDSESIQRLVDPSEELCPTIGAFGWKRKVPKEAKLGIFDEVTELPNISSGRERYFAFWAESWYDRQLDYEDRYPLALVMGKIGAKA